MQVESMFISMPILILEFEEFEEFEEDPWFISIPVPVPLLMPISMLMSVIGGYADGEDAIGGEGL